MVFSSERHSSRASGTHGTGPQDPPILTPALANSLSDTVYATLGYAMLAAIAISWAALISWSASDPSFTRTGLDTARNLVGVLGAFGADLVYQTLGVATFSGLLAPMFWAIAMIRGEYQRNALTQIMAYVSGIAGLAAAAALWRSVPGWPMTHGLGGIAGEHLLSLASAPLIAHLGDVAKLVAAAVCGLVGFGLTLIACGVPTSRRRKSAAAIALSHPIEPKFTSPVASQRPAAAPHHVASRRPAAAPRHVAAPRAAAGVHDTDTRRWGPDPLEPIEPRLDSCDAGHDQPPHPRPPSHAPAASVQPNGKVSPRTRQQYGPYAFTAHTEHDHHDDGREADFDAWTEASTGGMAARFVRQDPSQSVAAPPVNTPRALQTVLSSTFGFGAHADRASRVRSTVSPDSLASAWRRPTLNLLARPSAVRTVSAYTHSLNRGNSRLIGDALAEFGIDGSLRDIEPGPVVTTFLFEIARPTKLSRVIALASDIASHLRIPALRVSERRGLVAIELPNAERVPVVLRDCLDSEAYRSEIDVLPIALGLSAGGAPIVADLTQLSGLLVSGSEASARAIGLNAMILSLIYRHGPDDCRFVLIDPRLVDLAVYDGIPHLLTPVVADPHKAITALAWCVREMEDRMKRMSFLGVRNIELFNNRVRNAAKRGEVLQRKVQTGFDDRTGKARFETQDIDLAPMPYIVVVIEDLADLMAVAGREIEGSVARLAKAARAAGIHLIVATDRTTPDIVTSSIRDSLPARLSYRVAGRAESRGIIGDEGAEHLLAGGDSLLSTPNTDAMRIHGPSVSAEEVASVAMSLKEREAPAYVAELSAPVQSGAQSRFSQSLANGTATGVPRDTGGSYPDTARYGRHPHDRAHHVADGMNNHDHAAAGYIGAGSNPPPNAADELFDRAVAVAVRDGGASIGHLQSTLKVSAGWAANLLARLEADAVVGPADARGVHSILQPRSSQVA